MGMIAMPASVRIKHIEWSLDRPAQVNRSAYTGARIPVSNPWHGMWRGKVELAPIVGEANVRAWRAFLASLKGQINTFLLPATEGPQHVLGTLFPAITNRANTVVTNIGGNVYTIEKTSGTDGAFDASAVSSVGFSGDFSVRIKRLAIGAAANLFGAGVNTDPLTDDSLNSIDRMWANLHSGNTWYIYENAVAILTGLVPGTYQWLWRTGTTLGYGRGATLAAAQASPDRTATTSATLYFDSSLWSIGDKLEVLFSGLQSLPTAASGAAQGATSITLANAPSSLSGGMMATVTLPSGNRQMVMLTQDMAASVITFEPPLREAISTGANIDTSTPGAQVALADSAFGWSVDPGTQYGIGFNVEEAF